MPQSDPLRIRARALLDARGVAWPNEDPTLSDVEITLRPLPGRPLCTLESVRTFPRDAHSAHPDADSLAHDHHDQPPLVDLGDAVLLPGFVNAHAHLDLTHIGPKPFDPSPGDAAFVRWAGSIAAARLHDRHDIAHSVTLGVERSLRGGVVALGDIAGADNRAEPAAFHTLAESPLAGVSFIELFGLGDRAKAAADAAQRLAESLAASPPPDHAHHADLRTSWSFQPHAPYSAGLHLYRHIARLVAAGLTDASLLCTHLAETPAERAFVENADGPFIGLLQSLGVLDEHALDNVGKARSPVEHLAPVIDTAPTLLAHLNDVSDADIDRLARLQRHWRHAARRMASDAIGGVAYCPRASEYFHHHTHFGPHRYLDMIHAGVNVAIGTDSIVNLPPDQADRLSPLDDARLLYRRDRAHPALLIAMLTIYGARALGLPERLFTWPPAAAATPAPIAGPVAIAVPTDPDDVLHAAFDSDAPPTLLWDGEQWNVRPTASRPPAASQPKPA